MAQAFHVAYWGYIGWKDRFASPVFTSRQKEVATANGFEARVTPAATAGGWTAYWTVTKHNHSSRVKAGENSGEFLKHDFVVRQYTPGGRYRGVQSLKFFAIAPQPDHPRQINLIVSDVQTGETKQAASLQCL